MSNQFYLSQHTNGLNDLYAFDIKQAEKPKKKEEK
jgi:hypothetical protein